MNQTYFGLLQPLPIPAHAWHSVSMDFIERLPKSGAFDNILLVVDRLTKYAHFIPMAHLFTAQQVAKLYLDNIYKLHRIPQTIVSDRDKMFTSLFWQEFFKLIGTKLHFSIAYHPQTDGQTERVNRCLETYLRCMTFQKPAQWSKWLGMAE